MRKSVAQGLLHRIAGIVAGISSLSYVCDARLESHPAKAHMHIEQVDGGWVIRSHVTPGTALPGRDSRLSTEWFWTGTRWSKIANDAWPYPNYEIATVWVEVLRDPA